MTLQIEHHFPCPHCGAAISMLLDPTEGAHEYVEDCEVCCRPLRVAFLVESSPGSDAALVEFRVTDESA